MPTSRWQLFHPHSLQDRTNVLKYRRAAPFYPRLVVQEDVAMPVTLNIRDQLLAGNVVRELRFEVANERLTVRDLIRQRIHEEVTLYNLSQQEYFQGLVQPTSAETTLNGYRLRKRRWIDWEQQADLALQAFEGNSFFILVDEHQVESLDDFIDVREDTQIVFVKLIPLVGG
jgi:hypothetical protein